MNNEDRINYYLNHNKKFEINYNTVNVFHANHEIIKFNIDDKNIDFSCIDEVLYNLYLKYLVDHLKESKFKGGINIILGDNAQKRNEFNFLKTRNILDNKSILLKCFNYDRHWKFNETSISKDDIPFKFKNNKAIWRGRTTGFKDRPANRFDLVEKFFGNKNIDVAFTRIVQGHDKYKKYLKREVKKRDLLRYKIIIMIEGNDKASGLNWALLSNSVVMMPKPTICSWLMEDKLVPGEHYILIKDDFSDLIDKYKWAMSNLRKCQEINKNAKTYMRQFMNQKNEDFIEKEVIRTYFENII